jgi:hypothetical protein
MNRYDLGEIIGCIIILVAISIREFMLVGIGIFIIVYCENSKKSVEVSNANK